MLYSIEVKIFNFLHTAQQKFCTDKQGLVADLLLFCYERDFMRSLSDESILILLILLTLHLDIWTIY